MSADEDETVNKKTAGQLTCMTMFHINFSLLC